MKYEVKRFYRSSTKKDTFRVDKINQIDEVNQNFKWSSSGIEYVSIFKNKRLVCLVAQGVILYNPINDQ